MCYHIRIILENLENNGFALQTVVIEFWNNEQIFKLQNNTTIFALLGLLMFPIGSYLIEKLAAKKLVPGIIIDILIFILLVAQLIYPVMMIDYL